MVDGLYEPPGTLIPGEIMRDSIYDATHCTLLANQRDRHTVFINFNQVAIACKMTFGNFVMFALCT